MTAPAFPIQASNSGLLSFQDCMDNDSLATAAGNCTDSTEFAQKLNDATQRLMIRGDWPGTLLPMQLTVQAGVVTAPRIVQSFRAFNLCRAGVPVMGPWATFLDHYWSHGNCCGAWTNWINGRSPVLTQFGTGIQFAPIPTTTCVLKVYSDPTDVGAVIQFFGTNPSGANLTTPIAATLTTPASIVQGISITLGQPFTIDTNLVANLSRAIKPLTNAPIQVSALDQATGIETPIAAFDAGDTTPSFAQYRLHGGSQCTNPQPTMTAVALCKLKYVPVAAPTDLVTIASMGALAMMLKAIRFQDAGDRTNYQLYQADAVKELNLLLGDVQPDDQIPITINPWGSASPSRAGIGRLR